MVNLERFLTNPFVNLEVGLDKKKVFGETHIISLTVQNGGGLYTAAITATIAAQQGLFGNITNVNLTRALQKTQTENVDAIIQKFTNRNSRLNKHLIADEVDKTTLYETFFPQGVMEFTRNVTKGNVEQLMEQMISVITANTAVAGGAAVLTEYQTFLTDYVATRGLQLTKISEVSMGITNRDDAEAAWANQLFKNLLLISSLNMGNPSIINDFFDQSIVDIRHQKTFNYAMNASTTFSVKHPMKAGGKMIITIKKSPTMRIFASSVKDAYQGDMQEVFTLVATDVMYDTFHVDLSTHDWIVFVNLSSTDVMEFKVEFE